MHTTADNTRKAFTIIGEGLPAWGKRYRGV